MKQEPVLMSVSLPSIYIFNILVANVVNKSISLPISLEQKKRTTETNALLDTGAGGIFIDQNFTRSQGFFIQKIAEPLEAFNVNGTKNKKGTIKHYVDLKLKIGNRNTTTQFMVIGLGKQNIILSFPWFQEYNPEINWNTGIINWRKDQDETSIALLKKIAELIQPKKKENKPIKEMLEKDIKKETPSLPFIEEIEDEEEYLNHTQNPTEEKDETNNGQWIKLTKEQVTELPIFSFDLLETDDLNDEDIKEVWINAQSNMATDLAIKENAKKDDLTAEEIVPSEFHDFMDIFSKEKANQFPTS